jgi:heat shock protein HslJ
MIPPKSSLIVIFILVISTSCKSSFINTTETKKTIVPTTIPFDITNKTWKITIVNFETIQGESSDYYLTLNKSTERFQSKVGCNQIIGEFKISDQLISFSKIASTKMYCMETMKTEEAFLSILSNPSKFAVIDSSRFVLISDDMVIAQFDLVQ